LVGLPAQAAVNVRTEPTTGAAVLAASAQETAGGDALACQLRFNTVGALVLLPLLAETE